MSETKTKEKILKKVRAALIQKSLTDYSQVDYDTPVFKPSEDLLELTFANNLILAGGQFFFCEGQDDFIEQLGELTEQFNWKLAYTDNKQVQEFCKFINLPFVTEVNGLKDTDVAITHCFGLLSNTGSIAFVKNEHNQQASFFLGKMHVVIAYTSQVVEDMATCIERIKIRHNQILPSSISFVNGPSKTADLEAETYVGVTGPRELIVFLIDDLTADSQE